MSSFSFGREIINHLNDDDDNNNNNPHRRRQQENNSTNPEIINKKQSMFWKYVNVIGETIPPARSGAASVIVDDKLYIFG